MVYVFKETKDQQKFNNARRLGKNVGEVRDEYREHLKSKNPKKCQGAVALYFIDKVKSKYSRKNYLNSYNKEMLLLIYVNAISLIKAGLQIEIRRFHTYGVFNSRKFISHFVPCTLMIDLVICVLFRKCLIYSCFCFKDVYFT